MRVTVRAGPGWDEPRSMMRWTQMILTLKTKNWCGAGNYTATETPTQSAAESSVVVAFKASTGPVAPAITSANNTSFTVGTAGTFTVTSTGVPLPTLSETGVTTSGINV